MNDNLGIRDDKNINSEFDSKLSNYINLGVSFLNPEIVERFGSANSTNDGLKGYFDIRCFQCREDFVKMSAECCPEFQRLYEYIMNNKETKFTKILDEMSGGVQVAHNPHLVELFEEELKLCKQIINENRAKDNLFVMLAEVLVAFYEGYCYSNSEGADSERLSESKDVLIDLIDKIETSSLLNAFRENGIMVVLALWYCDFFDYRNKIRLLYNQKRDALLNNNQSDKKSSGGCYVATAVYGSYDCPEVWTLRRYRDNKLSQSLRGRLFIRLYYAISPTLVKWFGDSEGVKKICRNVLDDMIEKLQDQGYEDSPYEDKMGKY